MLKFYQEIDEVQFMGIRIENNLFYVESKGLSLIIENRDGFLY
ncbi:putative alpha-galactosidase (plasmid) [Streptococcus oralis]|nr:putative alpha-galactosidase [Streptococcus oralis]